MDNGQNVVAQYFDVNGIDCERIDGGEGCRARVKGDGLFLEYSVTVRQEGNCVQVSVGMPVKVLRGDARAVLMGLMDINEALSDSECFELDIMSGVVSFRHRETRSQWSECEVGQAIACCMDKVADMAPDIRKVLYGQHPARPDSMAEGETESELKRLRERVDRLERELAECGRDIGELRADIYHSTPLKRTRRRVPRPRVGTSGFGIKNPFRGSRSEGYSDPDYSDTDYGDEEDYDAPYRGEDEADEYEPDMYRSAPLRDDPSLPSFMRRRSEPADVDDDEEEPPMSYRRRVPIKPGEASALPRRELPDDDDDTDDSDGRAHTRRRV